MYNRNIGVNMMTNPTYKNIIDDIIQQQNQEKIEEKLKILVTEICVWRVLLMIISYTNVAAK